ncbi:MAG: TolC family protein, partial [Ferruginibacter sp.]
MVAFTVRKRSLLICFSLLIPAISVLAQQNYSLQNLVNASLQHFPLVQQKQAIVNAAHATIADVKHSFLPQVRASEQLNIGTDNSLAGSYFTFGITPSASAGVRANNTLDPATGNVAVVYSEYELYNFGLNNARLNIARSNEDLQQADLQKEQFLLQLEVARLYFNILKNKYRLQTDQENVARYDSIYRIIRVLTTSGIKAGSDSSLAQAE